MMEVGSSSRVRDVCEAIATKLQFASWEGCSLFIKITDKVWPCLEPGRRGEGREGMGNGLQAQVDLSLRGPGWPLDQT